MADDRKALLKNMESEEKASSYVEAKQLKNVEIEKKAASHLEAKRAVDGGGGVVDMAVLPGIQAIRSLSGLAGFGSVDTLQSASCYSSPEKSGTPSLVSWSVECDSLERTPLSLSCVSLNDQQQDEQSAVSASLFYCFFTFSEKRHSI